MISLKSTLPVGLPPRVVQPPASLTPENSKRFKKNNKRWELYLNLALHGRWRPRQRRRWPIGVQPLQIDFHEEAPPKIFSFPLASSTELDAQATSPDPVAGGSHRHHWSSLPSCGRLRVSNCAWWPKSNTSFPTSPAPMPPADVAGEPRPSPLEVGPLLPALIREEFRKVGSMSGSFLSNHWQVRRTV